MPHEFGDLGSRNQEAHLKFAISDLRQDALRGDAGGADGDEPQVRGRDGSHDATAIRPEERREPAQVLQRAAGADVDPVVPALRAAGAPSADADRNSVSPNESLMVSAVA